MDTFRQILEAAVNAQASDVHIKSGAPVMLRIARGLVPIEGTEPTVAWIESILTQILTPEQRTLLARERELDLAVDIEGIGRFRTNVFQQRGERVMALRIVRQDIKDFNDLNLPEVVRKIAEGRRGIVVVAGAPGAGKSTTLAAMVQHLNVTGRRHIITLEDPIEFVFRDQLSVIEQREIGLDTATFASGLRNVLRQDPDVLVIGEMRDPESVAAAIAAANVGTLVITTLHTGDAANSIRRILELFPSEDREHARRQLAGTLNAVVCQKLVRTKAGPLMPAVEILLNTVAVRKLLEENQVEKLQGVIELSAGDGMQTFDQALLALVDSKTITQAEAFANAPNPESLRMKLQGVFLTETRRILKARD
jgi:twitching motility protein PilT